MKSEHWKPAGLQKFNEFCMAVNEDCKSPAGQKFEEEYQQKALEAYAGKKLHKRKACPTATITVYLDVEGESTSSSMASVKSSQRVMASSAAAPRTQREQPATRSSSEASVESSQCATASLAGATLSQRGQPTSRGIVQRVAGRARRGSQAISGTINGTLVAAASNITPM
jgi:hypothetical protein